MALPKPSPGLLPAENYSRFGRAFDAIDAATDAAAAAQTAANGKAAQAALDALRAIVDGKAPQGGLDAANQSISGILQAIAGYAQAITNLQNHDGSTDLFIGALQSLTASQGQAIAAEASRAPIAEALARIIAAPKFSVPLNTITLPDNGAAYWDGATSTGATAASGGLRVPQGRTGALSQFRTRFQPTSDQLARYAGRPLQFMVAFRSSVGALTALHDSAGNSTLGGVIEGVQTTAPVRIYPIRSDLWVVVADAVLTGSEAVITIALQVSSNTVPVAADVTFTAIGALFAPVDATGTTDVLADLMQPLGARADNLIAAARIRYAPLLGASPGLTDRVLLIPAGQSGAGSLAIYGAPIAGLRAGTQIRCRFAIQVGGGAFAFNTVGQFDPPVTLFELFGATVEMTDGSQVGAVAGIVQTSPTTYEATVTLTATGNERLAEFYLKVDENSAVRAVEGQIRLGLMTVEVLSTDPTTTVAAQTARLMESFRAFIAATPDRFRDWCSASPFSDGDYGTIREAVAAMRTGGSQDQPNRVVVLPGTYTNEAATGVSITPADYVEIIGQGDRRDVEIIARLPDNQGNQDSQQPILLTGSARLSGLTVRGRNVKYPGHLEAGNSAVAATWDIDDCEFHHEGATGWSQTTALGVGQHAGNVLKVSRSLLRSPTSAIGIHNNVAWGRSASAEIEDSYLDAIGDSATSIALTSQGAGVMSPVTVRGCALNGLLRQDVVFLPGAPLSAYRGMPFEYTVTVTDSDPVDWLAPCPFDVLTLTSVAAGNSAVAVGGLGGVRLFGRRPDVRPGAADYAARVHSGHLVGVPADQYDPGVTLAARLGDMRGAPLPLDCFFDGGGPVTITLDQNYSGMTNAQVVANLNSKLSAAMGGNTGGRAFSLSQPYHNRAPIRQPDRETSAINAGTATIFKGHVLAKVGRRVRLMTSTDATSAFAGIALDDAVPGRSVRFLKTGYLGQAHLLFDGSPSFAAGAKFQVSANAPGYLVQGTDLPVIAVRSVEGYGVSFEILTSVLFVGSTAQAVRDAFSTVTINDIPGASAAISGKADKTYVDNQTAGLLSQTGDGSNVAVTAAGGTRARAAKDRAADYVNPLEDGPLVFGRNVTLAQAQANTLTLRKAIARALSSTALGVSLLPRPLVLAQHSDGRAPLYVNGATGDFSFSGTGATLLAYGRSRLTMSGIATFEECRGGVVGFGGDVTLDVVTPMILQGVVTAVVPGAYIEMIADIDAPTEADGSQSWSDVKVVTVFAEDTFKAYVAYTSDPSATAAGMAWSKIDDGKYRIDLSGMNGVTPAFINPNLAALLPVGAEIVVQHQMYGPNAVNAFRCDLLRLPRGWRLSGAHGVGWVTRDTAIDFDGTEEAPFIVGRRGRVRQRFATSADGAQLGGGGRGPSRIGGKIFDSGDDCLNLISLCCRVASRVSSTQLTVYPDVPQGVPQKGDRIDLVDAAGKRQFSSRVTAFSGNIYAGTPVTVTVADAIPAGVDSTWKVVNRSQGTHLDIAATAQFGRSRSAGVRSSGLAPRFTTLNVRNTMGPAFVHRPGLDTTEYSAADLIELGHVHAYRCNYGIGSEPTAVVVIEPTLGGAPLSQGAIKRVVVRGITAVDTNGPLAYIAGADEVMIGYAHGAGLNQNPTALPGQPSGSVVMQFTNCGNVDVLHSSIEGATPVPVGLSNVVKYRARGNVNVERPTGGATTIDAPTAAPIVRANAGASNSGGAIAGAVAPNRTVINEDSTATISGSITISSNGGGGTELNTPLSVPAAEAAQIQGYAVNADGSNRRAVVGDIGLRGMGAISFTHGDGTYPGGDNRTIRFRGTYRI